MILSVANPRISPLPLAAIYVLKHARVTGSLELEHFLKLFTVKEVNALPTFVFPSQTKM